MEEPAMTPGVLDSAPRAAKKLQALADISEETEAVLRSTTFKLSALRQQAGMSSAESRVEIEKEIRRQSELLETRRAVFLEASGCAERCRTFLTMIPVGKVLVDAPKPSHKTYATGGGFREAIENIRLEIGATTKALHAAKVAPLPAADRKARLRAHVEAIAKANAPRISTPQDGPVTVEVADPRNALNVLLAFVPDLAIAKLESMIDALPEFPNALAPIERQKRIVELTEQLATLEQREEALIERAATDEGAVIPRRLMASPAAVLGVLIQPKPVPAKKPERTIANPAAATAVA
jgi:hypothetical protein